VPQARPESPESKAQPEKQVRRALQAQPGSLESREPLVLRARPEPKALPERLVQPELKEPPAQLESPASREPQVRLAQQEFLGFKEPQARRVPLEQPALKGPRVQQESPEFKELPALRV
jgi:hypothetical protein